MTDKRLFTPGPLNCSMSTKEAMLRDLGSRDPEFLKIVSEVKQGILDVAGVSSDSWTCVLLQGSGTYAVEAVLQTTTPRPNGRVLVLSNGAYGRRMELMCTVAGIEFDSVTSSEILPYDMAKVEKMLSGGQKYTTVCIVHCETSSGVVNNVEEVARLVREHQPNAFMFVDAMSSFGALPLVTSNIDFIVSSANKCLQGVPGFAYAVCRKDCLSRCFGNSRSLSLDLADQDKNMNNTKQFRFTPPTHAILAFRQALNEFHQEGGLTGRQKRYSENCAVLKSGMKERGFRSLVDEKYASPIITCFLYPKHQNFVFNAFYTKLSEKGEIIYPGKVTDAECFRVGNIGDLHVKDIKRLLLSIDSVLEDMRVTI